jgi:molybdate-binding protein
MMAAAAKQFDLAFVPIISEHYMLTCRNEALKKQAAEEILTLIKSSFLQTQSMT